MSSESTVLTMYSDGGSRGNPGPSAAAFWIPSFRMGRSKFIESATNNVAEMEALILALEWAKLHGVTKVRHKADSKLVVNLVNGAWSTKFPHLQALLDKVEVLKAELEEFTSEYVPRAQNAEADRLCNLCMDAQERNLSAVGLE